MENKTVANVEGAAARAPALSAAELAELDTLSNEQLATRVRALDQEIKIVKNNEQRVRQKVHQAEEEVRAYKERIKMNNKLPYLVASVAEVLEMEEDPDDELTAPMPAPIQSSTNNGKDNKKKLKKSVVVKTTSRQTVYLPVAGLVDENKLRPDDLVGVNKDTYLILDTLPPEYDSRVKTMEVDEKPKEKYTDVGGLEKQINEMMEAVVLPITNKALYQKIGIQPPKGVLLYGSPGTGKTMLARACAAATNACFLRLAGPQLVQMFIGDGARIVRDAFALAKKKAPAIIFIDELDAVGSRRSDGDGKHGNREVQRTMLELLSQLDGFGSSDDVKVIAATNRIDVLDPALLRSGRLDRKVEFPMPDEDARARILEIHSRRMTLHKDVNFDEVARSTDDMNGAQLKAVCVEAGMLALRHDRTYVSHEDFIEGVAAVQAKKKASLNYYA